jgi:hypothetical protein
MEPSESLSVRCKHSFTILQTWNLKNETTI